MVDAEWNVKKDKAGKPIPRLNLPTPCSSCPRESPAREAETTITEKNIQAYLFWADLRATNHTLLSWWMNKADRQPDDLTKRILRTIDQVMRDHELSQTLQACSLGVLNAGMKGG
jgi:hypothetical protein